METFLVGVLAGVNLLLLVTMGVREGHLLNVQRNFTREAELFKALCADLTRNANVVIPQALAEVREAVALARTEADRRIRTR